VGQTLLQLGAKDRRLDDSGKVDKRFANLWKHWSKDDPAPGRVKPVPLAVIHEAYRIAQERGTPGDLAAADMLWVAYFFLCRPGEYTYHDEESRPFRFQDVQLWTRLDRLNLLTAALAALQAATCSALTFTDQKNGVRNECIALGMSGHAEACGSKALIRRVIHLRSHDAPLDSPISAYHEDGDWFCVSATQITELLRAGAASVGSSCGVLPSELSARSLRSSGAMAMMCGGIDKLFTRLRGRWKSDAMLSYLHVQAQPLVADVASRMLEGGNYAMVPGQNVPDVAAAEQGAYEYAEAMPAERLASPEENIDTDMASAAAAISAANPSAAAA
jgi:hypothetical protein